MAPTLTDLIAQLEQARRPADIFGPLGDGGAAALRRSYRRLAASLHPDANPGQEVAAGAAFRELQGWYRTAQQELRAGTYGAQPLFTLESARQRYECFAAAHSGERSDLYPSAGSEGPLLLKVARAPQANALLEAEVQALSQIDRAMAGQPLRAHFPTLVERFLAADPSGRRRQVNVLLREQGTLSLAEVLRAAPGGLHPADAAWIFNRILAALGVTHSLGLVHGAVLPQHVLLRPSDHNGVLIDWTASRPIGARPSVIASAWAGLYPPEAVEGRPLGPASDLFMAARCLALLLGGSGPAPEPPASTPAPLRRLIATCLIPAPHRRADDAWQLLDDFRTALGRLYGPPTFRPFPIQAIGEKA